MGEKLSSLFKGETPAGAQPPPPFKRSHSTPVNIPTPSQPNTTTMPAYTPYSIIEPSEFPGYSSPKAPLTKSLPPRLLGGNGTEVALSFREEEDNWLSLNPKSTDVQDLRQIDSASDISSTEGNEMLGSSEISSSPRQHLKCAYLGMHTYTIEPTPTGEDGLTESPTDQSHLQPEAPHFEAVFVGIDCYHPPTEQETMQEDTGEAQSETNQTSTPQQSREALHYEAVYLGMDCYEPSDLEQDTREEVDSQGPTEETKPPSQQSRETPHYEAVYLGMDCYEPTEHESMEETAELTQEQEDNEDTHHRGAYLGMHSFVISREELELS